MMKPRRRVELVMSVDEAEPCEEPARGDVRRVVPREKSRDAKALERMVDGTGCRLEGQALPPVPGRDVHTEFGIAGILPAWPQAATPDVLTGGEKEDRPVLNAMAPLGLDLALETSTDLPFGHLAGGNEPRDGRVAPQRAGKGEVGLVPATETEAGRLEEEVGHVEVGRRANPVIR